MATTTIKIHTGDQEEKKRYRDLDCAMTDCCMQSPINQVVVSKVWNKPADDATDYIIDILL